MDAIAIVTRRSKRGQVMQEVTTIMKKYDLLKHHATSYATFPVAFARYDGRYRQDYYGNLFCYFSRPYSPNSYSKLYKKRENTINAKSICTQEIILKNAFFIENNFDLTIYL